MSIFLVLGLLATTTLAYELKATRPDEGNFVFYDVRSQISLTCRGDEAADIQWYKNETKIESVKGMSERITVKTSEKGKESELLITKLINQDADEYSCRAKGQKQVFQLAANVFVKVPANVAVVEGEKFRLHCNAVGTSIFITWLLPDNSTIDEDGDHDDPRVSVETEGDAHNDVLIIDVAKKSDRGEYICEGRHGKNIPSDRVMTSRSYVRVKDKLAALWPFIGICSEVFILCAIILIYEHRRSKLPSEDDSDTDHDHKSRK